jgi:ATP-dependent phosphofructokinase / diphosphate-dependent phosphofructokinase
MKIGILTGGGDVPGLNVTIKTVVRRASERGWTVVGIRRGWAGLLDYEIGNEASDAHCLYPLDRAIVRTVDNKGGTILHTSRTHPGQIKPENLPPHLRGELAPAPGAETVDCTPHILKVLKHLKIDALITLGGDGTLNYAGQLHKTGFPLIAVPKTMDNDIFGTDYCIGFSTAVSRSVDYVTALRTTTGSHERIAVIELFGRQSGETALVTGYLADADRVLIAEVPFDMERVAALIAKDRADSPAHYAMLLVSEGAHMAGGAEIVHGATDPYGRKRFGGIGELVGQEIQRLTGVGYIAQSLAYLMRSGTPDSLDRMVATSYGNMAMQLLAEGKSGLMTAIRDGNYTTVPADTPSQGKKRVNVGALYDKNAYRPRIATIMGMPMFLY